MQPPKTRGPRKDPEGPAKPEPPQAIRDLLAVVDIGVDPDERALRLAIADLPGLALTPPHTHKHYTLHQSLRPLTPSP